MSKADTSFAVYTASGRILAMLAGFAMPIFLTRFLSLEDYGIYSQFYTILGFAGNIFAFGISSNIYYFYPRLNDVGKKSCVGNTILALLFFSFFALIIIVIPATSGLLLNNQSLKEYAKIIALCVFFYVPTHILYPLFVIRKDRILSVLFPPVEIVLKLFLVIVSALVWKSLNAILLSILLLHFILFLFCIVYAIYPFPVNFFGWIDKKLLKQQFIYILPFGLSIILFTLFNRFDKLLCIKYIDATEYAIYSIAFFGIPGINQIYDSLTEVNLLEMTKSHKEGNFGDVLKIYQNFTTKLLSFSFPIILAVCLYANQIFSVLFSADYLASVVYFRIYIFSFIVGAFGAGTVLRAMGNTKFTLKSYLLTAVVFIPFALLSIKYYGTKGAIATAMLGIILPKLFSIHFERKILGVSFWKYMPWYSFLRILMISGIALVPFAIVHLLELDNNIFIAGFGGLLYVFIVYFIESKYNLLINIRQLKWLK